MPIKNWRLKAGAHFWCQHRPECGWIIRFAEALDCNDDKTAFALIYDGNEPDIAWHLALTCGKYELYAPLLEAGMPPHEIIWQAINSNSIACLEYLAEKGFDFKNDGTLALEDALEYCESGTLCCLLALGATVSETFDIAILFRGDDDTENLIKKALILLESGLPFSAEFCDRKHIERVFPDGIDFYLFVVAFEKLNIDRQLVTRAWDDSRVRGALLEGLALTSEDIRKLLTTDTTTHRRSQA